MMFVHPDPYMFIDKCKIKIKDDLLHIERKNKFIPVVCPFKMNMFCGIWCALFHEPILFEYCEKKYWLIKLCKTEYIIPVLNLIKEKGRDKK